MGYSFQLASRILLYALSHRQDCTYHSLLDPHCRYTGPTCGSGLIRLVDMGFNRTFLDPLCMCTGPTCRYSFNQIGGHGTFLDPLCMCTGPTCRYSFNQIGGHGFQWDVLTSSLYEYMAYMWIWFNQIGRHDFGGQNIYIKIIAEEFPLQYKA